jgi:hypothetical protein
MFARGPIGTTALLLIVAGLPPASLCSAAPTTESKQGAPEKARHILFVVGDDNGYNDYGIWNDVSFVQQNRISRVLAVLVLMPACAFTQGKTITPTIDGLIESGIMLADYNTFKICSPSRASILTGRYPWGAGFVSVLDFVCSASLQWLRAFFVCACAPVRYERRFKPLHIQVHSAARDVKTTWL